MQDTKTKPKIDLEAFYEASCSNVTDAMYAELSAQLGVSAGSLQALGVGYYFPDQAWIFPERDETGKIIGLLKRLYNGKKLTVKGSKRGLSYIFNLHAVTDKTAYTPGRHNWVRASEKYPCPLCSKTDWCLLSAANPASPPAVICGRTVSNHRRECGFLHILSPEGDKRKEVNTVLLDTDHPLLLLEGASDVCAAYDLGFVGIGRPSDQGGLDLLLKLPLANRKACVVGENDAGAGVRGMEACFSSLRRVTGHATKLLPPSGVKDLRAWAAAGATQATILEAIEEFGETTAGNGVFDDDAPTTVAKQWLKDEHTVDGFPRIRLYHGMWLEYSDGAYQEISDAVFRGKLYEYLGGKFYQRENPGGDVKIVPYKATRARVNDIVDALNQFCPILDEPPCWLDNRAGPKPQNLIPFTNGFLDVTTGILHPLTPAYFNMCRLEYPYHVHRPCTHWEEFLRQVTNNDQPVIDLLQEWFGYNLVPDMSHERLLMIIGRRRSGKGTILDTLQAMLGQHYCGVTTLQSLSAPFGLQPLPGKLSAIISDVRTPNRHDAESGMEKILGITGGDPVTINRKHKEQLALSRLICRFTVAGNEIPNLTDHSRALEARTSLIHLPNTYVGREDRGLKARLCEEARSGALIPWALTGLRRLRERGRFSEPDSAGDLYVAFRKLLSPLTEFLEEYCVLLDEAQCAAYKSYESKDLVYEAYKTWCERRGMYPMWREKFVNAIMHEVPAVKSFNIDDGGRRMYAFDGLRLNKWAFSELLGLPSGAEDMRGA